MSHHPTISTQLTFSLQLAVSLAIPRVVTAVADFYQRRIDIHRLQLCRRQSWKYHLNQKHNYPPKRTFVLPHGNRKKVMHDKTKHIYARVFAELSLTECNASVCA
jgi:hypothetical protein